MKIVNSLFPLTAYFHSSRNVRKVVDKTYYTYGSELTCEEINHLVSWIKDVETFKTSHNISPSYDQYMPLVHMLNYRNIHRDIMVRFFPLCHQCIFCTYSSEAKLHFAKYVIMMFFNRTSRRIVCLVLCK